MVQRGPLPLARGLRCGRGSTGGAVPAADRALGAPATPFSEEAAPPARSAWSLSIRGWKGAALPSPRSAGTAPPALLPRHTASPEGQRTRRDRGPGGAAAGGDRGAPPAGNGSAGAATAPLGARERPLPARVGLRGRGRGAAGSGDVSLRPRPHAGYIRGGDHAVGLFRYGFAGASQVRRGRVGQAGAGGQGPCARGAWRVR